MTDIELFFKAVSFAADKHKGQTRKDGVTPYFYHLMKVAELVKDAGFNIKYQIAAILHDVLEDTDATENEVRVFGEDVLDAVKLLSKSNDVDEETYVNAILTNHMASVVKSADKMHNVWEASYGTDKKWAKKYIKKAMRYYYGKFSPALDHAIGDAEGTLCVYNPTKKPLYFTQEKMSLYSDINKAQYFEHKDLYERCTNRPNHSDNNMQYWYNELGNYYFCFTDNNMVWKLNKAGWVPRNGNPIHESEHGDELTRKTREEMVEAIEKKKAESYFYDFVDPSTL